MVRAQDKMTRNTTLGLTSEDGHQITSQAKPAYNHLYNHHQDRQRQNC